MSDRLISANSLISKLLVNSKGEMIPEHDCDNFPITLTIREVKDLIKNEPTAYDLDDKIQRLRGQLKDVRKEYIESDDEYETNYRLGQYQGIMDALDIVKGDDCDDEHTQEEFEYGNEPYCDENGYNI